MKLLWVSDAFLNGPSFGYSVHSRKLRDALIAAGVTMTADPMEADLAVSVTWPTNFQPVEGLRNLLFTQAELTVHPAVPEVWERIQAASGADMLVTSCTHSAKVLAQYYPGPIEVCPLGIDPLKFPFHQRKEPSSLRGERFRFLWVNNASDRQKGLPILLSAWTLWRQVGRMPQNCSLYIKTSGISGGEKVDLAEYPNVTLDSRELTSAELLELYHSAHAFLQTSYGEAWGLTVTEAMATGLPCVWTHWSAPLDYADETIGFPITNFGMVPFARKQGDESIAGWGARAQEEAIVERMEEIYHGYAEALERGKRASGRMHGQYTWGHAARRFIEICEKAISMPLSPQVRESAEAGGTATAGDIAYAFMIPAIISAGEVELVKCKALMRAAEIHKQLERAGDGEAFLKSQTWYEQQIHAIEAAVR